MASPARRKATVLTVDTGREHRARFYTLTVVTRGTGPTVREELLVPEGDELRTTHTHERLPEAA
jgi:hypothetical protein